MIQTEVKCFKIIPLFVRFLISCIYSNIHACFINMIEILNAQNHCGTNRRPCSHAVLCVGDTGYSRGLRTLSFSLSHFLFVCLFMEIIKGASL